MKAKILTVIIVFGFIGISQADIVNSNSIIQDDIEYYVQTDKSVYSLGEEVEMLYRITNLSQESVTFYLPQSPAWNFWAEKNDIAIWRAVNGWFIVVTEFTLLPSESVGFPEVNPPFMWDLRDDNGILVQPGEYSVIGGLYHSGGYYDYTKVSVPIEIVPEPVTFVLFSLGLLIAKPLSRRR